MTLAGIREIADLLGVSPQRAGQLTAQAGFPRPIGRLSMGPVWRMADVERWARQVGRLRG